MVELGVLIVAKIANRGDQKAVAPLAQNGTLLWILKIIELTIYKQ